MGRIELRIDESSINELINKGIPAAPPFSQTQSANKNGVTLELKATARARVGSITRLDLIGDGQTPRMRWSLGVDLTLDPKVSLQVPGYNGTIDPPAVTLPIVLEGSADVAPNQGSSKWTIELRYALTAVNVDMAAVRSGLLGSVDSALRAVDMSPMPGRQPLPTSMITGTTTALGQLFDQMSPVVTNGVRAVATQVLPLDGAVVLEIPSDWRVTDDVGLRIVDIKVVVSATLLTAFCTFE